MDGDILAIVIVRKLEGLVVFVVSEGFLFCHNAHMFDRPRQRQNCHSKTVLYHSNFHTVEMLNVSCWFA